MRQWNLFVGLLGNKFWSHYRKDGFIRTFLRGRPGFFTSIDKMGPGNVATRSVGSDEYGNQYYEDFDTYYYTKRRWVEFSEAHNLMSKQPTKIPPPWHGWLCNMYDDIPNKANFVEPHWRPPRSFMLRIDHPETSNFHVAPGSFGNQFKEENFEYMKQKSYLEWNAPASHKSPQIDYFKYDKVRPYDITQEN